MNLVIDIGNTRIKAAIFQNNKIVQDFIVQKENFNTEIANLVKNNKIKKSIIASVSKNYHIEKTLSLLGVEIIKFNKFTKYPINIKYKTPNTLGKDRIALAVGANYFFPNKNILIIGVGTCITYDFINKNKNYLGGAISPGLQIRFKALHTFTKNLPLIAVKEKVKLIGNTTERSILSGVINGINAEIDGIISQYKTLYPQIKIVLSGGDTNYFAKTLKNNIFANTKILMYGLNSILNYNAK